MAFWHVALITVTDWTNPNPSSAPESGSTSSPSFSGTAWLPSSLLFSLLVSGLSTDTSSLVSSAPSSEVAHPDKAIAAADISAIEVSVFFHIFIIG
jgi:hypothetical protein